MRKIGSTVGQTMAVVLCAPKHKQKYPTPFTGSNGTLIDNGYNSIEIVTETFCFFSLEPGDCSAWA